MKAAIVPEVNAKWEIREVDEPIVSANQVLIKLHASGICYTDVHQTKGHLPGQFPRILGHEPGLRPDGRFVAMGFDENPLQVSLVDLILKRIKIIGSQQNNREYLYEALQMVALGKVKVYAETYPFKEIDRAYERVANGQARFRAVVTF